MNAVKPQIAGHHAQAPELRHDDPRQRGYLQGMSEAARWLRSDDARRCIRGLGRNEEREAFLLELLAQQFESTLP